MFDLEEWLHLALEMGRQLVKADSRVARMREALEAWRAWYLDSSGMSEPLLDKAVGLMDAALDEPEAK